MLLSVTIQSRLESHIYHSSRKTGRDNRGKELKERKRIRGLEVRKKKAKIHNTALNLGNYVLKDQVVT